MTTSSAQRPTTPARRRGIAMLVVLVVVTMISLAGLSFVALLSAQNKAIRTRGAELQMESILASGQELMKSFVASRQQQDPGNWYDNTDQFHNVQVVDDPKTKLHGWFSIVSPRLEDGEARGIRFGLENESARLHLGMVWQWEQKQPGAGRQALLRLPGMTKRAADATRDSSDPDAPPRESGAEADFYTSRGSPYGPRDGVPASLEELLLVRGVTRDLLFGTDANFNHVLDPGEGANYAERLDTLRAGGLSAWYSLLTIYSAERNVAPDGGLRINLNDANLIQLGRQLTQIFDRRTAAFVIAYRQFGPYQGPPLPLIANQAKVNPAVPARFQLASVLDLVGAQVQITGPAGQVVAILDSPLKVDRTSMQEYLPQLLDYTTVDPAPVIVGRVNVNLAPRTVLEGVPGLDENTVTQIVASRQTEQGALPPERAYPTWLLQEGIVDLARMKALMPFITTGGDVYRAQIVGYYDRPSPTGRAEVVIDATNPQPRQLFWKDLAIFGRGYPPEWLAPPTAAGKDAQ
jgi:DNA uptake protein ComE-like DNA-binding protein